VSDNFAGRRQFLKMKRCNWTSGKRWSTALILRSAVVIFLLFIIYFISFIIYLLFCILFPFLFSFIFFFMEIP